MRFKGGNIMIKQEYLKFKRKLLDSGIIYRVTKSENYILIEPDQTRKFSHFNDVLECVDNSYIQDIDNDNIISTEFFDLKLINCEHFNNLIYSVKYKIV